MQVQWSFWFRQGTSAAMVYIEKNTFCMKHPGTELLTLLPESLKAEYKHIYHNQAYHI